MKLMKRGADFKSRFGREVRQGRSRNKESASLVFKRVIKDGFDGAEFIVSGGSETTFGQACKDHWQFDSVSRNSGWFIKDERGNDVTDMFLTSFDGICILIPEYGSGKQKKENNKASEYTSIHDSVEYYD